MSYDSLGFKELNASKFFWKRGCGGIPPPNPLLPAPPERIRQAKRGVIFLQNTFALCLEYSTASLHPFAGFGILGVCIISNHTEAYVVYRKF